MKEDHQQNSESSKLDYSTQIRQIIQNVSGSGKYQVKLIVFLMFLSLFTNMQFNSSHLFYMNPSFYCDDNTEVKVKEVNACNRLQSCIHVKPDTLTAELHLYCDSKKDDRVFIQSAPSFGNLGGIFFAFFISDRYGRKFSIILSLILINIGILAQYVGNNQNIITLLWMAEIIYGFSGKVVYVNVLIICTRFLRKSLYEGTSVGWYIVAALPTIIVSVVDLIFPNWRWLLGFQSVGIFIIAVISFFVLLEDPIYYFDCGKYQQFKQVIQDISDRNGTSSEILEKNLQQMNKLILAKTKNPLKKEEQSEDDNYSYFDLLDCRIIQATMILGLAGMFYTMSNSSISFALPGLNLQYDYNLIINGFATIIGFLTSIIFIRSDMKRKTGFLLASALCGCAGMLFGFKFVSENTLMQTILINILRIANCWGSAFRVRLKVDLFPEKYQAAIMGFIELLSNFGKMFSPYVTEFSNQKGISPLFVVSLMFITIGTLPVLCLVEKKVQINKQEQSQNQKAKE